MYGNDFLTWTNPDDDAVILAVANGIKETDPNHLHTVELTAVSASRDSADWASLVGADFVYTYYPTYAKVLAEYALAPAMPVFLGEANYEFESLQGYVTTPEILRRQAYWTMLSGATGQFYGNGYTWRFVSGWQGQLDTPGAVQMKYLKTLFAAYAWYELIPDQAHAVVVAGYGTFSEFGGVNDNDYATVARRVDGTLVMAYMPSVRTITVDMTQLSGRATARWYDPSDGTYTTIAGSPFVNTGTQQFRPPGNNSDGGGDWVLVMEAETSNSTPAGAAGGGGGGGCFVGTARHGTPTNGGGWIALGVIAATFARLLSLKIRN
jgi:hypothetical protein